MLLSEATFYFSREIGHNDILNRMSHVPSDEEMLTRFRKTYPGRSDEELREARERLREYLLIVWRINARRKMESKTKQP